MAPILSRNANVKTPRLFGQVVTGAPIIGRYVETHISVMAAYNKNNAGTCRTPYHHDRV